MTVGPSSSDTSSSDPLGSIISSIPGLDSILNNLTQQIGDGLSDVQGEVVGALVSGLGLKDFYILYATKMCEGNTNSNRGINVDKCYSYHDEGQGKHSISDLRPFNFFKSRVVQLKHNIHSRSASTSLERLDVKLTHS